MTPAVVGLVLSCSTGAGTADDDDDGQGAAGSGTTNSAGGTAAGTGTGGSGGAGVVSGVAICQLTCTTAADCDLGTVGYQPANHVCPSGYCEYTGCNSDSECQALGNYDCRDSGTGVPQCVTPCSAPADCSLDQLPFDADNYACTSGYCAYTGCNSDAECQALDATLVCRDSGAGLHLCLPSCAVPADCDLGMPANDADNYLCQDGACIYTGCNSDAECQALGNYVCR